MKNNGIRTAPLPPRLARETQRVMRRLVRGREEHKLSQRALSVELGGSPSLASQWETLRTTPNLSQLVAYADRVGLRIEIVPKEEQ
jgi:transcriptional regulator with XRE-family HTH domain